MPEESIRVCFNVLESAADTPDRRADLLPQMQNAMLHSRACTAANIGRLRHSTHVTRPSQPMQHRSHREGICRAKSADTAAAGAGPRTAEASPSAAAATASKDEPSTSLRPPTAEDWELDFSSRPILDSRGKKRWELLLCSPGRGWVYSRWFPNNKINSAQLKLALLDLLELKGAVKPKRVRFFRGQMQTIIGRALADLDIKPVPSRRCFTLMGLLEERLETVYKQAVGYSDKATSLFTLDLGPPQDLPDALRGESWMFVQLPLELLQKELKAVLAKQTFGDTFPLEYAGLADLPPQMLIPGIAVYSRRAVPLAAWTAGLELANVVADADRACLVLESGVTARWRYGNYRRTPENTADARAWEAAKIAARGMHFLVVQKDEDAEDSAGLWLMQNRKLPNI